MTALPEQFVADCRAAVSLASLHKGAQRHGCAACAKTVRRWAMKRAAQSSCA